MPPTNRIQRVARAVFCQMVYNHHDGDATCQEPRLRCAMRQTLGELTSLHIKPIL